MGNKTVVFLSCLAIFGFSITLGTEDASDKCIAITKCSECVSLNCSFIIHASNAESVSCSNNTQESTSLITVYTKIEDCENNGPGPNPVTPTEDVADVVNGSENTTGIPTNSSSTSAAATMSTASTTIKPVIAPTTSRDAVTEQTSVTPSSTLSSVVTSPAQPANTTHATDKTTTTPSVATTGGSINSTHIPKSIDSPWHAGSFFGGMALTVALTALGFIGYKFYKSRTERNYHTL